MFSGLKQQDIDLWEIWIEYDPSASGYFGTLYILGEVLADPAHRGPLLKRTQPSPKGTALMLELAEPTTGRSKLREAFYAEPVRDLGQYSAVYIYARNRIIACFDEIEILI